MPRLCQNDRGRAVGMVHDQMTHQAVADHFNVSRLTVKTKDLVTAGRV